MNEAEYIPSVVTEHRASAVIHCVWSVLPYDRVSCATRGSVILSFQRVHRVSMSSDVGRTLVCRVYHNVGILRRV
jgi:hypothetical protein